jgi:gliding motility-associated-like protein
MFCKKNIVTIILIVNVTCCHIKTLAQLCTGSLGDPVVNIDFGTGYGGNTSYYPSSAYSYTSSNCPNDGFYTITTSTSNCFNSSWHTVRNDHTGNGAFLLVNASYTPGDFMVTKVASLCPNITYEFAAWMLNVLNRSGIKPNITFSIETESGLVLQKYDTGPIAETGTALWKQYGFFFTTPANNPVVVLRITNNAPGGIGNDIALDDITFRPCTTATLTTKINGFIEDTVNVCEGLAGTYNFNGTISGNYNAAYRQWQLSSDGGQTWSNIVGANSANYVAMPTAIGKYYYRFIVAESMDAAKAGCSVASNKIAIYINAKPFVSAGGNRFMIAVNAIVLNGKVDGDSTVVYWQPPNFLNNATITNPIAIPTLNIKYTLHATSKYGCYNFDTALVKVVKGIFVPNIFTPTKDGKNDTWRIPFLDASLNAKVSVFNRFGQRGFYCQGCNVNWDGTFKNQPLPAGGYVYQVKFLNGEPDLQGSLLLLR